MTEPETPSPASEDPVPKDRAPGDPAPETPSGADERLLSRFTAGDDSALGSLVDQEAPRILRRVEAKLPAEYRKRVGASDILQLTAMELVTLRHRFENQGMPAFRAFLDKLVDFNLGRVLERERAQKRNVKREVAPPPTSRPPLDGLPGNRSTPSGAAQRREGAELLQQAFEALPLPDQEIIVLVDYEDLPYAEAAEALGITEPAARRRHSRAVDKLRQEMRRRGIREKPGPG